MAAAHPAARWLAMAGGAAAALAFAIWWQLPGAAPPPAVPETRAAEPSLPSPPQPDAEEAVAADAAAGLPHIPASGRLAIRSEDLPEDGAFVLSLGLSDEGRGQGPRPARIVAVDGRTRDATAVARGGAGSGVRIEIDPAWLIPGRYMIEVRTAEKTHLPLRRYVLEVR